MIGNLCGKAPLAFLTNVFFALSTSAVWRLGRTQRWCWGEGSYEEQICQFSEEKAEKRKCPTHDADNGKVNV